MCTLLGEECRTCIVVHTHTHTHTHQGSLQLVVWVISRRFSCPIDLKRSTESGVKIHPKLDMLGLSNNGSHFLQTVTEWHGIGHLPEVECWLTLQGHLTDHPQEANAHLSGRGGGVARRWKTQLNSTLLWYTCNLTSLAALKAGSRYDAMYAMLGIKCACVDENRQLCLLFVLSAVL